MAWTAVLVMAGELIAMIMLTNPHAPQASPFGNGDNRSADLDGCEPVHQQIAEKPVVLEWEESGFRLVEKCERNTAQAPTVGNVDHRPAESKIMEPVRGPIVGTTVGLEWEDNGLRLEEKFEQVTMPREEIEPIRAEVIPASGPRYYPTHWRAWPDGEPSWYSTRSTRFADQPDDDSLAVSEFTHSRYSRSAGWYFQGGAIALQRDRGEGNRVVSGGGRPSIDGGGLDAGTEWGGRFSVGTRCWENCELEVSGFWVPNLDRTARAKGPSNLTIPVKNPPVSFENFGTNASVIAARYETDIGGIELMVRKWDLLGGPCECAGCGANCSSYTSGCFPFSMSMEFGVRYLNVEEGYSIYSQFGPLPSPIGSQDFRFRIDSDNHLIGPQVGVRLDTPDYGDLDILIDARGMLAANVIETHVSLRELTGNRGIDSNRDEVSFAQVLEFGAYLRWKPAKCLQITAGYQLLWINGYAGAPDQFDRNLSRADHFDDKNSILLHGPALWGEFTF